MVNKSIVEAKFRRKKVQLTYTFLWVDLSENAKKQFDWVKLNQNEDIILCYKEDSNMYILTTQRVILFDGSFFLYEILKIQIIGIDDNKAEINSLKMIVLNENEYELRIEKNSWSIIYNLLRFLIVSTI